MKKVENEYSSVKERYFFKLGSNLVGLAINLGLQAIVPRGLGPRAYGDYNLLINSFNQIIGFLDMGTSNAFYTKLSQKNEDMSLVSFYWYFSALVCFALLIFILLATEFNWYKYLWPDQMIQIIYLAAIWGILTWFGQIVGNMADAYSLTIKTEKARMVQRVFSLGLIGVLFVSNKLDLVNYFYCNLVITLFLIISFGVIIRKSRFALLGSLILTSEQIRAYFKEFYQYCSPLVVYAFVSLVINYLDRWLLQIFNGSLEQGFFGLSYQISAVCFIFTGAMTPLLIRELSIAHSNNDLELMATYFRRYVPLFYSIAAYFACFIAVQAHVIVQIFGGESYGPAITAVMIMSLYPIHQTYGQLSGAVFFASGQTALYRNIGISTAIAGIILTFLFIAPVEYGGLYLGAYGLALKMVLLQLIAVNIQLYYNAKYLNLKLHRYLLHQILSLGGMLLIAFLASFLAGLALSSLPNQYITFVVSGLLYSTAILLLASKYPRLFGLDPEALNAIKEVVYNRIR